MKKSYRRNPRNYNGARLTSHGIAEVLPDVLKSIGKVVKDRPDLIIAAWPDLIGPKLAAMTVVESFIDGVLTIKVKNSTLLALLKVHDKPRILQQLRMKFPRTQIKNIYFRTG